MRRAFLVVTWMMLLIFSPVHLAHAEKEKERERDYISNPTLPQNAPEGAIRKRDEAVRAFLLGLCDLNDALKSLSESSNSLIERASERFAAASEGFFAVRSLIADAKLAIPDNYSITDRAVEALKWRLYEVPRSYNDAFNVLGRHSRRISSDLKHIRYKGNMHNDIHALNRLLDASQNALAVFGAVSEITLLGQL